MPRINLLPWREEKRNRCQKIFVRFALLVIFSASLLTFSYSLLINHDIDQQVTRNQFIQQGIDALDRDIAEVQALKKKREQLLNWVQIIQHLQADRGNTVQIMNEMAHANIEHLYLTQVSKTGNILQIKGIAQNNHQISRFMRHLARSSLFDDPVLTDVNSSKDKQDFSRFTLQVSQTPYSFAGEVL